MKKRLLICGGICGLAAAAILLFSLLLPGWLEREKGRRAEESWAFRQEHSLAEDLTFRFDLTRNLSVGLYPSEDGLGWYAYLPSQVTDGLYPCFRRSAFLTINDLPVSWGDNILPFVHEGEVYTVRYYGWEGELLEENKLVFYFTEGLPSLFLSASENTLEYIEENKDHRAEAEYVLLDPEGREDSRGGTEISCRGNTSFACEQKPYNLKLDLEASLLGMESGRKWALLANNGSLLNGISATTQQLKNKIIYDLARELGMAGAPECEFLNLYLNGEYRGLYLLSEKVDPDRIPDFDSLHRKNRRLNRDWLTAPSFQEDYGAPEDRGKLHGISLSRSPENVSGGYLLEMDERYREEKSWFTFRGSHIAVKSPKEASYPELAGIYADFARADGAVRDLKGISPETGLPFTEYIDLDSWVRLYLIEAFFMDRDIDYSSLFFYKKANDSHFYAGPVWDFDLTMGESTEGTYHPRTAEQTLWFESGNRGLWMSLLDDHELFRREALSCYKEEFSPALSRLIRERYDDLTTRIASSVYMNSRRWHWEDIDFSRDAAFIREWLQSRRSFLDSWTARPEAYYRVTFRFAWGDLVYMAEKEKPLGFLPLPEYGEDDRFWGKILAFAGPDGEDWTPEEPVRGDVTLTAVYEPGGKADDR